MFNSWWGHRLANTLALVAIFGLGITQASAQEWSEWIRYGSAGPIDVFYKTKVSKQEIRVGWKCRNTDRSKTYGCSIGTADHNKQYRCFRAGVLVGTSEMLSEGLRGIKPQGEDTLPTDWACRGLSADALEPTVEIRSHEVGGQEKATVAEHTEQEKKVDDGTRGNVEPASSSTDRIVENPPNNVAAKNKAEEAQQQGALAESARNDRAAEALRQVQREQRRRAIEAARQERLLENKVQSFQQSFYAGQAVDRSRDNIDALADLSGNYSSAAELEADFERRMRSLRQEYSTLEQASHAQMRASADMYFNDTDPAVGELMGTLGNMINDAQRANQEQEARAALARQREQKLHEIQARRKTMMIEMRRGLLAQFADGGVPLSSHKVDSDVLYFFSYTCDAKTINQENPVVKVANTFAVHRYGDGSWPFKASINRDLQKIAPGPNTLVGFYASKNLANSMRNSFIKLAKQSGFAIKDVHYERRDSSNEAVDGETFWSGSADAKPSKQTTDFWDSGAGQQSEQSEQPKEEKQQSQESFWE